jgi:lipoprotein-anchoring transpeptidase ErfK/SrfK
MDEKESLESKEEGTKDDSTKSKKSDRDADTASKLAIQITKEENMLELRDGDKLVAAFPVTVGSEETASPIGEWKVRGVAKLPNFRYDKKMLKEGERSSEFHLLPPGPNNPVGIIWIALNRKGVGIHGSDSPDAIGRDVSHGCIRLANWDIVKLASMVKAGVPVTIR